MDFLKHSTQLPKTKTRLSRDTAEQACIGMSLRIINTETGPDNIGNWVTTYTVTDCKGDGWKLTADELREVMYHNYTTSSDGWLPAEVPPGISPRELY